MVFITHPCLDLRQDIWARSSRSNTIYNTHLSATRIHCLRPSTVKRTEITFQSTEPNCKTIYQRVYATGSCTHPCLVKIDRYAQFLLSCDSRNSTSRSAALHQNFSAFSVMASGPSIAYVSRSINFCVRKPRRQRHPRVANHGYLPLPHCTRATLKVETSPPFFRTRSTLLLSRV